MRDISPLYADGPLKGREFKVPRSCLSSGVRAMDGEITARAQPGQVWADNRKPGRTLRVDSIGDGKAACTVLANSTEVQAYLDEVHGHVHPSQAAPAGTYYGDQRGTVTRIAVARLRPGGYTLVQDA